jgi:FtsP/CotA-like multicopper oxidase with cupredoxin domain
MTAQSMQQVEKANDNPGPEHLSNVIFWINMLRSNDLRRAAIRRLAPPTFVISLLLLVAISASSESLPPILANQNHVAAGTLRGGVLTVHLEIAKGVWHPEADDGVVLSLYAFGESGQPLQNPGPLIRVPLGTEIHAWLHNALPVSVSVHGLGERKVESDALVRVAPGAVEQVRFTTKAPGLYFYWAATEVDDLRLRNGVDAELTGAIVVDPPGVSAKDEIFVMEMISEVAGLNARQTLATINGKSWPYTHRFQYSVGEEVHWRWVNATNEPHALHLHGFYYRVDAVNRGGKVETYEPDARPLVVTQRIAQGETFDMSWSPSRSGNWLFHCHMLQHMIPAIIPKLPGLSITPAVLGNEGGHAAMSDAAGMGQLVLGITVPEAAHSAPAKSWHADRKLRLEITERTGHPRYAIELYDPQRSDLPSKPGLIGPPLVLTRGEPVEVEVLNRLKGPTAIHWHGIELESYYDGVPGWSGAGTQITPAIAPGSSFLARMVPPRSGTFIYHTHWHDASQLTNGLYGPLIVLPEGVAFDPKSDLTFVFSIGDFGSLQELALINGTPQSKNLQLEIGRKYRFRFINISTNNQGMQVSLRNPGGPVEWVKVAKDGADLPAHVSTKAQETITVGETFDVEFSTAAPQDLLLDLLLPGQKIHTIQTLSFQPVSHDAR